MQPERISMEGKGEPWFKVVKKYSLFGGIKLAPGTLTLGMLFMTAAVVVFSVFYNRRTSPEKRPSLWPSSGTSHIQELNKALSTTLETKIDFIHELMKAQTERLQDTTEFLKYRLDKLEADMLKLSEASDSQSETIAELKEVIRALQLKEEKANEAESDAE